MIRRPSVIVRYLLQQLVLLGLAVVAARVGSAFVGADTGVSWLWPAAGLGLAALTMLGLSAAPAFALGCLLGHVNAGMPIGSALAGATVDTLQAMLGALMMRTWPDFRPNLSRLADAFVFVVSAVVSATAGSLLWAAVYCASGLAPWSGYLAVFKTWAVGNLMGGLLVAPPLLTWVRMRWARPTPAKIVETGGLFLALGAAGIVAYFGGVRGGIHSPLEYLPFPVAIWAAMRFGVRGATAATVVMASVALAGHNLFDPPGTAPPDEAEMLVVQASLAVGALTALLVGAVTTERDETMSALGESEQRATALFNQAPDAIFIMDGDRQLGHIVAANPAAADLHDIPQQELSKLWLYDLEPTMLGRELAAELRRIADGERLRVELTHQRRDGTTVDVEMHASPIEVGGRRYIIAFNRDVTSRNRAHAERQLMELKLQETQKLESLGLLAGGIAHDFNNLLTGILGNASLARDDSPDEIVNYLEQIERAAERAADLCGQMLAYAGKARFEVQPVDLSTAVDDTTALIKSSIGKNVRLVVELARDLPPVEGDQTQIRQIIMNLVLNASEAIDDRPGTIRITTGTMTASREYLAAAHLSPDLPAGQYVYLEVADTGRGMSKTTLAKIFDPFFSTKFTGRGLGLAAVLGIVRGHRGALRVHSEDGKGSTFRLLLPAGAHLARSQPADRSRAPVWRGSGRALIIDDESAVRLVATRMLQAMGFDAVAAANGPDGVELLRERPDDFKFVLLDLTMPGASGDETYHALRTLRPDLPVILMSGFTHQEVAARFEGQHLAGFIQKPFRGDDLRHVVRTAIQPATDAPEPALAG